MEFQPFMPAHFIADPPNLPSSQPSLPPRSADSPQIIWDNPSNLTPHRDTYPFIDPFRFKNGLKGKVAIVTLAHRGIGKATALAFAQAGASVCCIGPSAQSLEPVLHQIKEKHGTPTLCLTADLAEPEAPAHIVKLVEKHLGQIDILINITAASYFKPFAQEKNIMQDWWPNLEKNLRAPIALIHAVLPSMIARNSGTIISTTAATGILQIPFASAQGVANSALLKFHHHLDLEIRDKGIFSYAVNPGPIPSYIHDPNLNVNEDLWGSREPRMQMELAQKASEHPWAATGLASGTFVALCADPRARVLSGLYVNAERDLEELIASVGLNRHRVDQEQLYVLKVTEF